MKHLRLFGVLLSGVASVACGSTPTTPPPPVAAPTLACPASLSLEAPGESPVPVSFLVPTASGGQSPVAVSCAPQSGTLFPVGNTVVTCTATDGLQRTASCNFNVTLIPPPRISKVRFLAFGDSITYGRCNESPQICSPYTARLQSLLEERYPTQTFAVTASGAPGENASDDIPPNGDNIPGQDRLPDEITRWQPEVLLLMEGTNDIINGAPDTSVDLAAAALDAMVGHAMGRGVVVFLATIPPQRYPPPPGTRDRSGSGPLVEPLNARIKAIAASRGAHLVDIHAAMNADLAGTISVDNLHPTELGLRVIADTFYASIRAALEVPTGTAALTGR